MRFLPYVFLALLNVPWLSAAPGPIPSHGHLVTKNIIEDRGAIDDIVEAILDVAEFIVSEIINLNEENAQKEGKFTTDTVSALLSAYPDKNVVVYYDQDSGYEFYNGAHRHYELDLELGFTKGYEIWVFDYGWFELAGDGGYQNWAYGGCVDTTDSTYSLIYFCDIVVTL